ncbi:MAG: glycosyltransferase [Candidatus Acidiferrales bacterium]
MRILKISQSYYPFLDAGGPPTKIRAIASKLAERGHHVTVLTPDLGLAHCAIPIQNLERCAWGWRSMDGGVETIYLRSLVRYRALTLSPDVVGFCRRTLGSFDLSHLYGLYDLLGPAVASFCSRRNVPYVLEPMGMFRPIVRSLRLKRLYHQVFGNRVVRGARFLIATSEKEKQEFIAGGIPESRIFLRRNGIDAPASSPDRGRFRQRWGISENAKLILFLGRLVAKKSPDMLIEAFARWQEKAGRETPAILALAGPEEEASYLRELKVLSGRLHLDGKVLFTGPLYDDAKWSAYRDADVFVLPSQHENFGNTAAESAACGTPVIVTEECGIGPILKGRAGVVVPHSVAALEEALSSLASNSGVRDAYREGCAAVTRELSWDEPIAQMESLYARCIAEAAA